MKKQTNSQFREGCHTDEHRTVFCCAASANSLHTSETQKRSDSSKGPGPRADAEPLLGRGLSLSTKTVSRRRLVCSELS